MQPPCPRLWKHLGSHPSFEDGCSGYRFRVWAPHARQVSLIGAHNAWNHSALPMEQDEHGEWTCFVPGLERYADYKYAIHSDCAPVLEKADPFAFHAQTRPGTASKCYDLDGFLWDDSLWLAHRLKHRSRTHPLNIYEVHFASWRRTGENQFLSYREMAHWLVPYVKQMGFTHVQFLPLTEHPLDESLGYQSTGLFAPTSRYGTPHDLMFLINELHKAGIGAILDLPFEGFPKDDFGLYRFDSHPLYEQEHDQSTCQFNFDHPRVREFLTACALFWLEEYHFDGVYLRTPDTGAEEFLRQLKQTVSKAHPDAILLSDTPISGCSTPPHLNRDLYWTDRTLRYARLDPYFRQFNHGDITAFPAANTLLAISHDEVCPKAGSLLQGIHGGTAEKFASLRALYTYMLTWPGKKLTMMGCEFGQEDPWRFDRSLDWHLPAQYGIHFQMQEFVRTANALYLASPALWRQDDPPDGFRWVCTDDAWSDTVSYLRFDKCGRFLLIALNFSPVYRPQYRLGVPADGRYEEVLNTDCTDFGGTGRQNPIAKAESVPWHGMEQSIEIALPPLSAVIMKKC